MDKLLSARDIAALERDRDQLWAEAAAREARGESIQLPEELWAIAEREQKEATEDNLFLDVLDKELARSMHGESTSL